MCLKYAAEKKRNRGALLLHLTPANRLHAVHSFQPRRAHSRRRPSPIRFFSGKYRHKSLCARFSPDLFKNPHTYQRHYRIGAAEQTASAVVCRIAPLRHSVDLYGEIIQNASENAEDRDLRLEYMYAKSTVLSVLTTTVSVTRRKQMEIQGCFREREVEEAGRQTLLFV